MSNYSKTTNFATKDALASGDPLKVVKGTDINTEFDNIATAVASKTDNAGAAITSGAITGVTINSSTIGATVPSTGAFTTLGASGASTLAAVTASGLVTANAGETVASGQTLTLTGATVAGAPTWSSNQAVTLSTAAQPNVTSLGTLTSLTMGGALTMGANTLALASATVSGTPTWSSNQAVTLSTAAQPNVTSVGTLTSLTMGGTLTVGANTLALASATVSGTPTWSSNQAVTVSTAAQPNITSVGTLTSLTTSGTITTTAAASKLVPGATSFSHRNNADNADNLLIADNGNVTIRGTLIGGGIVAAIAYVFDGGGAALTTGVKGDLLIPFACTINSATLQADQSGSIVIDIWKKTYTLDSPPAVAQTITASAKPTLASHQSSQDATLSGWTTSVAANDMLRFNIDSITTCTRVTLTLKVTKT